MRRAAELGRARAPRGARGGGPQRNDRGAPSQRLAYRFTHELVRQALYDRLSRLRRAELHLRVGEALEHDGRGPAAGSRTSPTTSLCRAGRRRRARGRVQPPRRPGGRAPRSRSTQAAERLRDRARARRSRTSDERAGAARARLTASHRAGKAPDGAGRVRGGGGDRPELDAPSCSQRGDRLRGAPAGGPGIDEPGRGRAARRGGRRAGRRSERAADRAARRARPGARLPG